MSLLSYLIETEVLTDWECMFYYNLSETDFSDMSPKQKKYYRICEEKISSYISSGGVVYVEAPKPKKKPKKKAVKEKEITAAAKSLNEAIEKRAANKVKPKPKPKPKLPNKPFKAIDGGNSHLLTRVKLGDKAARNRRLKAAGNIPE